MLASIVPVVCPGKGGVVFMEVALTISALLSVCASTVGIASSWWLCRGSLSLTPEKIIKYADDSWEADPEIASRLISQSAEYLAGALLLFVSFAIQVTAALLPPTMNQDLTLGHAVVAIIVCLALGCSVALGGFVCRVKTKRMETLVTLITPKDE